MPGTSIRIKLKSRFLWKFIDGCSSKDRRSKETTVVPAFLKKESEEAGTAPVSSKKNIKENWDEILATTSVFGKEKASKQIFYWR